MTFRTLLLSTTVLTVAGVAMPLIAATAQTAAPNPPAVTAPPAVDGLNGKFEALGGDFARKGLFGGGGSVAMPLQGQFGIQLDGAVGSFGGSALGDAGAHLFWRDPREGLVGVYLNETLWDRYNGVHVTRLGPEGEYYWGPVTLGGVVGVEAGNDAGGGSTTSSAPSNGVILTTVTGNTTPRNVSRFFDHLEIAYYPLDNWKASIGHVYAGGKNAAALDTEYAMSVAPNIMASLFVEGHVGEGSNNYGAWGGIRFYFGQHDKTLKARQREDDPAIDWIPDSLLGIAQSLGTNPTSKSCSGGEVVLNNGTCGFLVSDIRLKRDIVLLARLENGIGLYRYRYLWSDTVYIGVMAQEVAPIVPEAVIRGANGYFSVDYARLGLRLQTFAEWLGEETAAAA